MAWIQGAPMNAMSSASRARGCGGVHAGRTRDACRDDHNGTARDARRTRGERTRDARIGWITGYHEGDTVRREARVMTAHLPSILQCERAEKP